MAQSPMTTVYVLFATAAAMTVFAALLWFGVVDIGLDPGPSRCSSSSGRSWTSPFQPCCSFA